MRMVKTMSMTVSSILMTSSSKSERFGILDLFLTWWPPFEDSLQYNVELGISVGRVISTFSGVDISS